MNVTMVDTLSVLPNPKNRNDHPQDQILRLCEIIKYQGFRIPLIISNRSGMLVSGHGRLLAAKFLGLKQVPVLYQDFESEDQEYAAGISDNSIASWSELDLKSINTEITALGPDFNIDLLGIKDFVVEPSDKFGDENLEKPKLSDRFIVPPFSVLDTRQGYWQERKRQWLALGIKSEIGRGGDLTYGSSPQVTEKGLNYYRNRSGLSQATKKT